MTPKDKAQQIKAKLVIFPEDNDGVSRMTFGEMNKMLAQQAIACVNIIIDERERKPASYWKSVKKELEAL